MLSAGTIFAHLNENSGEVMRTKVNSDSNHIPKRRIYLPFFFWAFFFFHSFVFARVITQQDLIHLFQSGAPQRIGLEMEFGTVGVLSPRWGEVQIEIARKTFRELIPFFGGNESSIFLEDWAKHPQFKKIVYRPREGFEFEIVPESVSSSGVDGLELVSPAFDNKEDLLKFHEAIKALKSKRLIRRGLKSSNHQTFDISHLMQEGQQDRLFDLILFIESNWSNIYRYVNPQRYGTIINRFGVPLAANQQSLLKELAQVPRRQRTLNKLKEIFEKYNARELEIQGGRGNEAKMWKYRAANYGKLLNGVPVLEFRIPDLDLGTDWLLNMNFLSQVIHIGSQKNQNDFKNPLGEASLNWQSATDALVLSFRRNEYESFLRELEIEEKNMTYHFWSRADTFSEQERQRILPQLNRSYGAGDRAITFGIEAEFRNWPDNPWIDDSDSRTLTVNSAAPDFLSDTVDTEDTGNTEIRSRGGDTKLVDVKNQFKVLKNTLGNHLRGFHMHMRIPYELYHQINRNDLDNWFTLISDYIWSWRLQERNPFFALRTETQGRHQPSRNLDKRGSLRVTEIFGDYLDVEIRGFMADDDSIIETAQMIMAGILNPKLIQTQHIPLAELLQSSQPKLGGAQGLTAAANDLAIELYGSPLSNDEFQKLSKFLSGLTNLPPILELENVLDFLAPHEVRKIREARRELLRRMVLFARGNFKKMRLSRFADFANSINLHEVLKRGILRRPENLALENQRQRMFTSRRESYLVQYQQQLILRSLDENLSHTEYNSLWENFRSTMKIINDNYDESIKFEVSSFFIEKISLKRLTETLQISQKESVLYKVLRNFYSNMNKESIAKLNLKSQYKTLLTTFYFHYDDGFSALGSFVLNDHVRSWLRKLPNTIDYTDQDQINTAMKIFLIAGIKLEEISFTETLKNFKEQLRSHDAQVTENFNQLITDLAEIIPDGLAQNGIYPHRSLREQYERFTKITLASETSQSQNSRSRENPRRTRSRSAPQCHDVL